MYKGAIPQFPDFKRLILADKDELQLILEKFPPYSDFNFTSLWSYDTRDSFLISKLQDNLIIKFLGYFTDRPFFSFIGKNNVPEVIEVLLNEAKKNDMDNNLRLVPEVAIRSAQKLNEKYSILEDRDNFDYILSVSELKTLQGGEYASHRKIINRLMKKNIDTVLLDVNKIDVQNEMLALFEYWEISKKKEKQETEHEFKALKRLLRDSDSLNLFSIGVYTNASLIGFSIVDLDNKQYAQIQFSKTSPSYNGLNRLLHHELAKRLYEKGYEFINIEQDLGIPGLRYAKEHANPIFFLRKYLISEKNQY